jgi:hypothetical protein
LARAPERAKRSRRSLGALSLEQSDECSLQRDYLRLEGLQPLADNRTARLSKEARYG